MSFLGRGLPQSLAPCPFLGGGGYCSLWSYVPFWEVPQLQVGYPSHSWEYPSPSPPGQDRTGVSPSPPPTEQYSKYACYVAGLLRSHRRTFLYNVTWLRCTMALCNATDVAFRGDSCNVGEWTFRRTSARWCTGNKGHPPWLTQSKNRGISGLTNGLCYGSCMFAFLMWIHRERRIFPF